MAARVADIANYIGSGNVEHLVAIHAAPEWLWSALVAAMVENEWSVDADVGIGQFMQLVEIHAAPEWLWSAIGGLLQSERAWRHQWRPSRPEPPEHANTAASV